MFEAAKLLDSDRGQAKTSARDFERIGKLCTADLSVCNMADSACVLLQWENFTDRFYPRSSPSLRLYIA